MKVKNLCNISSHAHHNYKIPKDVAIDLIKDQSFADLKKVIVGGIKSYMHTHGNSDIEILSLEKRITGAVKEYYARLLTDRYILDWLTVNRIDLGEIQGELRNGLINVIKGNCLIDKPPEQKRKEGQSQ